MHQMLVWLIRKPPDCIVRKQEECKFIEVWGATSKMCVCGYQPAW